MNRRQMIKWITPSIFIMTLPAHAQTSVVEPVVGPDPIVQGGVCPDVDLDDRFNITSDQFERLSDHCSYCLDQSEQRDRLELNGMYSEASEVQQEMDDCICDEYQNDSSRDFCPPFNP